MKPDVRPDPAALAPRERAAVRIHQLLQAELGHSIELARLLDDPLYARDVLLVCDACQGSELVDLAIVFREASDHAGAAVDPLAGSPHSVPPRRGPGFGASTPGVLGFLSSEPGRVSDAMPLEERRRPSRRLRRPGG